MTQRSGGEKKQARKSPAKGHPRRLRLSVEERRQQLLEAVEKIVSERGTHGATVPRVVARAGLAQGSFYRHFNDINEAICEVMQRAVAPIEQAAAELGFHRVENAADLEWELLRFYRVLAHELSTHPATLREALMVAPAAGGKLGAKMSEFLASMRSIALKLVEANLGRPPFRTSDDAGAVAAAVVGMILGAAREACDEAASFDPEQWAREMARFETGALIDPAHYSSPEYRARSDGGSSHER